MVIRSGHTEGDLPYPSHMRVNPAWEWGMGRGGGGRLDPDHAGVALRGSQLRIQIKLLGDGRADCEGIGLRYHSRGGSCIRGWEKIYQEPSRNLPYVVNMTLRLYGCP